MTSKPKLSNLSYEVGYGKPPKHTQFPKGSSGNRGGKKRGEENVLTVFKRFATRKIKIRVGDETRTMPYWRGIILKNLQLAIQKGGRTKSNIHALLESCGELADLNDPKVVGMPVGVPRERMSIEEWTEKFAKPDNVNKPKKP